MRRWQKAKSRYARFPEVRFMLLLALAGAMSSALNAQHAFAPTGSFDPAIPTPRAVLGYEIGERFTQHHDIIRYLERLATASRRVRLDTLGRTFEGRVIVMAAFTSEVNQQRMSQIRQGAQWMANAPDAPTGEPAATERISPTIVWLGYTVHGNEASGTEAALALAYQLAAAQDAETKMILDSTVVLMDPVQNPDGHERHAQDVARRRGALGVPTNPSAMIHGGTWPGGRTSHYYFDLNRDWFIQSHPESRARASTFTTWWPHVAVDLHEMGSNSTYFFAPPMAPVNKNVEASIVKWWDIFAASNAAAFDRNGWAYFRREGYDEFYPGYGISWPILTGAVGMTYEQASSAGGAVMRSDGTVMTLHDAALHHYTAAWATLRTSAARRSERVRDYVAFRKSAISDVGRAPMRSVIVERDAHGRADSLARRLIANGIIVKQFRAATEMPVETLYGANAPARARVGAGSYVIDLAQPQGRLAKALLEPDAQLDSSFIREELEGRRTGQPSRFYDVTAWSLPFAFRVKAWWTSTVPAGADIPVAVVTPVAPANAAYGYAVEPGSESTIRFVSALLADSVKVWYAQRAFRSGGAQFPQGAWLVRTTANNSRVHEIVRRHAASSGARVVSLGSAMVDEGADLGSNSVFPVRQPRVALLGGTPVQGNSFGFAWYALDQRMRYPSTSIEVSAVQNGVLSDFDVLIVPSANGLPGSFGEDGDVRVARWVRDGGVLVTIDASTTWLASVRLGLSRLRLRRDSTRADSAGGAPLGAGVPGAIVRTDVDTLSPLLAGMRSGDVPVMVFSDRIYQVPRDLRAGEAVVRFAPEARLRLAGYLWPEVPARLAGSPYLWTERVGRGRIIGFNGDPNFRDLWRGLFPLFANAVLLGGSF